MQIEKIKTIGDAYMAAAGLPRPWPGHTAAMAEFAFAMLATLERINRSWEIPFQMRIGVQYRTRDRRRDRRQQVHL